MKYLQIIILGMVLTSNVWGTVILPPGSKIIDQKLDISFNPSIARAGEMVTFEWSLNNGTQCSVYGLPDGDIERQPASGSISFIAEIPVSATTVCFEIIVYGLKETRAIYRETKILEILATPIVNIDYPVLVAAGLAYDFTLSTTNADTCTVKWSEKSYPIPISTQYKTKNGYSKPGDVVITVTCENEEGSTTKTHDVRIARNDNSPPSPPKITTFINGDILIGQTKLYWNSNNTEQCELESDGITIDVGVREIVGYPVSIPFGGRTFTLTCFQNDISVRKELFVPRPRTQKTTPCTVNNGCLHEPTEDLY